MEDHAHMHTQGGMATTTCLSIFRRAVGYPQRALSLLCTDVSNAPTQTVCIQAKPHRSMAPWDGLRPQVPRHSHL